MKKNKPLTLILLPLLLLSMFVGAATAKTSTPSRADRLKADYIYIEGNSLSSLKQNADAYMLLRRAHELYPEDVDIAGDFSEFNILLSLDDSAEFEADYNAVKRRFLINPADVPNGASFVKLANDTYRYKDELEAYRLMAKYLPNQSEFQLEYAWKLAIAYANGDSAALDSAYAIYDRQEQRLGICAQVAGNRMRALSIAQDTLAMEREIRRIYKAAPQDINIVLIIGDVYSYLEMPDSALHYFNIACDIDSTSSTALQSRANCYLSLGDSAKYDSEVFRLLESPSLEFEPKLQLLTDYTKALYHDPTYTDRIRQMFDKMEEIHPGETDLHFLHGIFLVIIDEKQLASEQFGYAVDLDPSNANLWRYRIDIAAAAGDTVTAVAAGRSASDRFDNVYFPILTASLLMQQDSLQSALDVIDSYDSSKMTTRTELSNYHQFRGDILYKLNRPDSAFAAYDKSLSYDPDNALTLNNAAYFMACENRDLDRAETLINRALHELPTEPTYLDTYAWVLFKKKRYTEAHIQIDKALDAFGISVNNGLVTITDISAVADTTAYPVDSPEGLEYSDDDSYSDDYAAEEVEDDSSSSYVLTAEILDHAGDIYFMCGEPDVALQFWEMALEREPENEKIKKKITHKAYFFE